MSYVVVLILIAAVVLAIKYRVQILKLLPLKGSSAANGQDLAQTPPAASQAATAAQGPVVVNPDGSRSAPSNAVLDGYLHSNTAYVDPGTGNGPAENNRPDPGQFIDYTQWPVGGFDMIGKAPRVLQNVTGNLEIVFDVRPETAPSGYTATVNSVSKTTDRVEELKINATGPTVNISVDQPDNARVVMSYNKVG